MMGLWNGYVHWLIKIRVPLVRKWRTSRRFLDGVAVLFLDEMESKPSLQADHVLI
jgi:hypothetical protein